MNSIILKIKFSIQNLKIFRSEFSRNVLTLTSGTAVAQAIPVLISPILTRLYSPSDFGTLALFISITSIISVISCGRYELAIMLPEKDEDAINVAVVAFIFNIATSFLFLLFIIFFGDWLLKVLKAETLKGWIYLAPLTVFFMGIFNILNYTNNRFKLYKDIAKANVYKSIAMAVVQIGLGFLKMGAMGLLTGQIFSQLVANTKLFKNIVVKLNSIDLKKTKQNVMRYKKFPTIVLIHSIFDSLRLQGIYFLLNYFFDSKITGIFFLAWKVTSQPLSFITSSFSMVYFNRIVNEKDRYYFTKKSILKLLKISLPIFLIIFLFGKFIFKTFFGPEWELAGVTASYLTPWLFINFATSHLAFNYIAKEKQEIIFIIGLLYFFVFSLSIILLHHLGYLIMVKILSINMFLFLIIYLTYTLREIKNGKL